MGWFRSEEMEYVSIIIPDHSAYEAVGRLGELGAIQFEDLNTELTAFQRRYTNYLRRCDELERILRYFQAQMDAEGVSVPSCDMDDFNQWRQRQVDKLAEQHSQLSVLDTWEAELKRHEQEFLTLQSVKQNLLSQYVRKVERFHLITKAQELMGLDASAVATQMDQDEVSFGGAGAGVGAGAKTSKYGERSPSLLAGHHASGALDLEYMAPQSSSLRFDNIAGIMDKSHENDFKRLLRRVSRGNCFVQFSDVEDLLENEQGVLAQKVVFIIFFRAHSLKRKLERLCDAFDCHCHPVGDPYAAEETKDSPEDIRQEIEESSRLLADNRNVAEITLEHISTLLDKWLKGVRREKATYHTLNMMDSGVEGMLRGRGWVLKNQQQEVVHAIQGPHSFDGGESFIQRVAGAWPTPPTHFHTNKFTGVFQEVVNTYGVPRYREANPALFTAITFPFLFAIMYGDIGHAVLLFTFSLMLVLFEKPLARRKLNELVGMAFGGRYMLLLMGGFSIYCGVIYNDCFSLPVPLFDSRYDFDHAVNGTAVRVGAMDDVYPFGVDPAWHRAENGLLFFNSLKMKISVVFGVVQMTFGILLKMSNAIHFKSKLDLWFESLPQLLFMLGLFGYMLFLIFFKWSIDWSSPPPGASAPPSLIDTLIGIVLTPGTVHDSMFFGQDAIQILLLLIVFISVPVMLLTKPLVLRARHRASQLPGLPHQRLGNEAPAGHVEMKAFNTGIDDELPPDEGGFAMGSRKDSGIDHLAAANAGGGHGGHGGEEFDFVEVMIHQAIETIEFVLGAVSNTASYLRLWALSLAHSELAEVFWERALLAMINSGSFVGVFIGYAVFAAATFGVLCVMDVLECFLHALRLHWVEFQNKFYTAGGYLFQPFHFGAILAAADQAR